MWQEHEAVRGENERVGALVVGRSHTRDACWNLTLCAGVVAYAYKGEDSTRARVADVCNS